MTGVRRAMRRLLRADDGSLTVFVAIVVPGLLLLIGLAVDGGNGFRSAQRADAYAAEAARAGAQAVDPAQLLAGHGVQIDPQAARDAANAYLTSAGMSGTVNVDLATETITVDIDYTFPTQFLGLVGKPTMTVHGHASAVLLHGVTQPEPP